MRFNAVSAPSPQRWRTALMQIAHFQCEAAHKSESIVPGGLVTVGSPDEPSGRVGEVRRHHSAPVSRAAR